MDPNKTSKTVSGMCMTETVHKTASIMRQRVDGCLAERGGNFQRFNKAVNVISLVR